MVKETLIGTVSHYYNHIGVAIVDLKKPLYIGQVIHFKGHSDDFYQAIDRMEVEHEIVPSGSAGQSIGVKVSQKVHEKDKVFLADNW